MLLNERGGFSQLLENYKVKYFKNAMMNMGVSVIFCF